MLGVKQNTGIGPAELLGDTGVRDVVPPAPPVGRIMLGTSGVGSGGTYRPHPALPPAQHLDYMNKFVQALVVVVLGVYLLKSPGRAIKALERRAGVA
jgi:hypothetical protein